MNVMLSLLLSPTRTPDGACFVDYNHRAVTEEAWILEQIRVACSGKFDLNTLRLDVKIFESAEKKLRIQKYPDS